MLHHWLTDGTPIIDHRELDPVEVPPELFFRFMVYRGDVDSLQSPDSH